MLTIPLLMSLNCLRPLLQSYKCDRSSVMLPLHTSIFWYMVYGVWYMVYGVWYMVYGIWYMVYGFLHLQPFECDTVGDRSSVMCDRLKLAVSVVLTHHLHGSNHVNYTHERLWPMPFHP